MSWGLFPEPKRQGLVISVLGREEADRLRALRRLSLRFGTAAMISRPLAFGASGYYNKEMGSPLFRRLVLFSKTAPPRKLAVIKKICMSLERDLAQGGRRRVNLDPGLLGAGSLILATTKYMEHRICLESGLFADITLWFHHGRFHPLPWTYPDYAGDELRELLAMFRIRYLWQLKQDESLGGLS